MASGTNQVRVESSALTLVSRSADDRVEVRMVGNADSTGLQALGDFLDRLHADALAKGARSVVIDCRELYFMNSSCLNAFVRWIHTLRSSSAKEKRARYGVTFLGNKNLRWQSRSFPAIQGLAKDLITDRKSVV